MLKKIWLLAILTLPLVGSEFFRLSGIPITTLFLLFLLLLEFPKPFLSIRKNKYFKYLLIYVLVNIVVSVFDLNRSYDVLLLENFIIKQIVLLLFSISLLFNIDKYGFDYFLKYFNIASITLITALFVRSYFILGSPYFVVTTMDEINENGKNQLSFYLSLTLNTLVASYYYFNKKRIKQLTLFFVFLTFYYVIYSDSRGGLLSVVVPFILIKFLPRLKKEYNTNVKLKFIKQFSFILLVVVMLVNFVNLTSVKEKFQVLYISVMQENDNNSDNIRRELLSTAIDEFSNNPLIGIGTQNFSLKNRYATHNNYMQILSENGVFIFSFFVFILMFYLKKAYKDYYFLKKHSLFSLLGIICFIIYFNLINGFYSFTGFIFFSIIIYTLNFNQNNAKT